MHPYIHKYREAHRKTHTFGGKMHEQNIRNDFINLINDFATDRQLRLIPELESSNGDPSNNTIPDGTLKDQYQCTCGYYEAKDPHDDLDREVRIKLQAKHYRSENILFENSIIAVLYQEAKEVQRIRVDNDAALEAIIIQFLDFKRQDILEFERAIATFKDNIPELTQELRNLIVQAQQNLQFIQERNAFLKQCQVQINPNITNQDIREMIHPAFSH